MLEHIPVAVGHALGSVRPGLDKIVYARPDMGAPETLHITSDAFAPGAAIPAHHTDDGAKVSPPLRFQHIPAGTVSLALVVEDADSPTPSPLCHAMVWRISPEDGGGLQEAALDTDAMPTARCGAAVGKNSFMQSGWLAPDPPPGHGPHRYAFQLFALDYEPALEDGAGRSAAIDALKGHLVAKGLLIGTYERR